MYLNGYLSKKILQIVNKHRKRCSASLGPEEMQIKTVKHPFIPVRMVIILKKGGGGSVGEDVEKMEILNWCNYNWKRYGSTSES